MKHTIIPCERSNKQTGNFPNGCLQCVTVASRLLQVEELAEILAFDFDGGPIPKLREERRLKIQWKRSVLSTCLTLLSLQVVNVGDSQVVQFGERILDVYPLFRKMQHDVQPLPHFYWYGTCSYRHHSSMSGYSIALGRK